MPNDCADGVCTDLGGGKGTCLAGPNDTYCSGALNADGDGYIGCGNNGDCAAVDSECGGRLRKLQRLAAACLFPRSDRGRRHAEHGGPGVGIDVLLAAD